MGLDSVLSGCGVAVEIVLVLLLLRIRFYRKFPAFQIWFCWSLINDIYFLAVNYESNQASRYAFEISTFIDSALMFAVLVELAWAVLSPMHSMLPRYSLAGIALLVFAAGTGVWLAVGTAPDLVTSFDRSFFRLMQTDAILRVAFFAIMAGLSQLLSLGWRDRELQIATGFGLYSIVSLAVTIVHQHQLPSAFWYHRLDEVAGISYIFALCYWVFAFATKEAERRDFTPQMQNFLLAAAGSAKAARISLGDTLSAKNRKSGK